MSELKSIEYKCTGCHKTFQRKTNWISPKQFSGKPIMKITCWCPECGTSNLITCRFIEYTETIKVSSVENSPLFQEVINEE